MFTNKKREGINRFVCDASLYVAKTSKASIKYHKPPLPIIPCGIVAYGFVGQPFSKQLYIGFLGQWFNNLQRAALLTSSVEHDKILCKILYLPISHQPLKNLLRTATC